MLTPFHLPRLPSSSILKLCRPVRLPKPLWDGEEFPIPTTLQKLQLNFSINVPNFYLKLLFPPDCQKHRDFLLFKFQVHSQLMPCFPCSPFPPGCISGLRVGRRLSVRRVGGLGVWS